jgi:hypothetical protein
MITLEELNNLLRDETEWNQEFIPFEGQSKPSTNLLVQSSSANQLSLSWDYGFFQHPGSITLTDMMGREITQRALPNLVDQNQHELQWNESLAQGVYIVRITDGMNTLTRKVFIASH